MSAWGFIRIVVVSHRVKNQKEYDITGGTREMVVVVARRKFDERLL